jgi:hypothetical protein
MGTADYEAGKNIDDVRFDFGFLWALAFLPLLEAFSGRHFSLNFASMICCLEFSIFSGC